MIGINLPYLFFQLLYLALFAGVIVLPIVALFRLRQQALRDWIEIFWVLIILLIPIFGALACLIVRSPDKGKAAG